MAGRKQSLQLRRSRKAIREKENRIRRSRCRVNGSECPRIRIVALGAMGCKTASKPFF